MNAIAIMTKYGLTIAPIEDETITFAISSCVACRNYNRCKLDDYVDGMIDTIKDTISSQDVNIISAAFFECPNFEILGG